MPRGKNCYVHPMAEVSEKATLGNGVKIWFSCQIRDGAIIGDNTTIGAHSIVDTDAIIGQNVKIQAKVLVCTGVTLEDGVFLGPGIHFTNDRSPRAILPNGERKGAKDWTLTKTVVGYGTSIGGGATIVCGANIGRWALIGAGSVVTRAIPDHAIAWGNPARVKGYVCACGTRVASLAEVYRCSQCGPFLKVAA